MASWGRLCERRDCTPLQAILMEFRRGNPGFLGVCLSVRLSVCAVLCIK